MDDITFCLSDCQRTDCYRHPSNIQDRTIPHSYADFKETETCPEKMQLSEEDATKDATFDYIDRQANCDYCHEDSDGYVRPIERNAHAVLFKGVLRIKGYGYKWDVKINCCPMCGRRLTDG